MEATIRGLPGIALSLDSNREKDGDLDFSPAAEIGVQISRQVVEHGLPEGVLLNINVPYKPIEEIKGIKITQQGQRVYRETLIHRQDPHGGAYYWIGGDSPTGVLIPGTDFSALEEGFVSITPLQLDLTAHNHREAIEKMRLELPTFNSE
jgi:5'-nucleotidase